MEFYAHIQTLCHFFAHLFNYHTKKYIYIGIYQYWENFQYLYENLMITYNVYSIISRQEFTVK